MKLKESAKENLALFGIFLMVVIGGMLIAFRNQQYDSEMQKKTDSLIYKDKQISQKN